MQDNNPEVESKAAVQGNIELESIARTSGASIGQVAQLARGTHPETDLDDAAAAAARSS